MNIRGDRAFSALNWPGVSNKDYNIIGVRMEQSKTENYDMLVVDN